MKYNTLIIAVLCLASCSVQEPDSTAPDSRALVPMTFTGISEKSETRTTLSDGYSVLWSETDEITLFSSTGETGTRFRVNSTTDEGATATFSGLTTISSNNWYYALYPAQEESLLVTSSGTINASLPTEQTGVLNSFPSEAALAIARVDADSASDDDILHFRNVGALLAFTVPGNYIDKVRITSRDGSVAMSGTANIKYNDGNPVVSPTTASKNYVEVTVPKNSAGKKYYAAVYPANYSQGFTVSFFASQNFNTYTSSKPLDLKRNGNVLLINKNWTISDDRSTNTTSGEELISPEIISALQVSATSATIKFRCNSGKRNIYKLYCRDAASMGEGTLVESINTGLGDSSTKTFTFTGLATGASYDFGVRSSSTDTDYGDSPITWFEDLTINAVASDMTVSISSAASTYYGFVINWKVTGLSATATEHGLIISHSNSTPTCGTVGTEGKLPGPEFSSTGTVSLTQCVPNAAINAESVCYLRAYCYDNATGNYVYSPVVPLTLDPQPSGYSISRSALKSPGNGITLCKFTAAGRYSGYCAIADCSSSSTVRLGVNNAPLGAANAISMATQQSSSGALVLVNGQIFGNQGNIGLAYTGGSLGYNNASAEGISNCRGFSNNYTTLWQPITRAILGVDSQGIPGAYWCSLIDGTPYFFDRPIPAGTAGTLKYPQVTASSGPGPAISWSPYYALSTGPMLLYDGKVCVSEDKISLGIYYTNYELWETSAGNIYGSSRHRTAIGYDSAGNICLVFVNTDITLTGMALIMKGLGCTFAMNLDGGGSTQMTVKGMGELTGNNRSVKSTIGFFSR